MEGKRVSSRAQRATRIAMLGFALAAVPHTLRAQSTIRFRVVDDTGSAFSRGRATIIELERSAAIENGSVTLENVPAGLWHISVRAIGFYPESLTVRTPLSGAVRTINMHRMPETLAAVPIVSHRDSTVLGDIERRMRVASGTLITADNPSVRNSTYATDAIRIARGFTWKSPTRVATRGTSGGGANSARCESLPSADSMVRRVGARAVRKVVAIYLDGSRLPGGLESINRMVPVADILAIEAYPDVLSAPFQWRTNDACAVIAYWTKRP